MLMASLNISSWQTQLPGKPALARRRQKIGVMGLDSWPGPQLPQSHRSQTVSLVILLHNLWLGFGFTLQVDPWLDHSINGVEILIGQSLLKSYDQDNFNCNEMAAYLEQILKMLRF